MMYKNYRTVKTAIAPGLSLSSSTQVTQGLADISPSKKRLVKMRQFFGAMACVKSAAQGTYTVKLILVDGSTEYQMDEVVLNAGESAVWTYEEYGLDLSNSETVKLEITGANTTSTDRVYLFLRTRDVV